MHQTPTYSYCPAHFIQNSLEKIISRRRCRHLWPPNTYTNNQQPERKKDAIKDIPEYPRAPQFLAKWNWQHQARSAKTQDRGFPRDIGWKLRGERHLSRTTDPRTTPQKTIIIKIKQQEISSKHTPTKSTNYKITEYKWTATTFITFSAKSNDILIYILQYRTR